MYPSGTKFDADGHFQTPPPNLLLPPRPRPGTSHHLPPPPADQRWISGGQTLQSSIESLDRVVELRSRPGDAGRPPPRRTRRTRPKYSPKTRSNLTGNISPLRFQPDSLNFLPLLLFFFLFFFFFFLFLLFLVLELGDCFRDLVDYNRRQGDDAGIGIVTGEIESGVR